MNQFWKDVGLAFTMGFIIPGVILGTVVSLAGYRSDIPSLEEPITITEPHHAAVKEDLTVSVLKENGEIMKLPMHDYLTSVLLAEIPASFEEEALKAQSVVARTYTMRAVSGSGKHEDANLCTNSSCCQGYMDVQQYLNKGGTQDNLQKIREVVQSTEGKVLTYEGKLIEATYFSCSGGATEDAVAVWGTDVPYLKSVSSPGEEHATHYTDTVSFSADDFAERLGLELTGSPVQWFSAVTYTKGGGVESMTIGGEVFTGTQLRALLDLRSTAFTVTAQENLITIVTRGYGHRVGMSQYGADAMAASGCTYPEILAYYYQGTELTDYSD